MPQSLGGCHADFGAGMGIEHMVAVPRQGAFHNIADAQGLRPLCLCLAHGCQSICCFARLGNKHHKGLVIDHGIAVAELGPQVYLNGQPHQLLDHELPDQARIIGCAAGHKADAVKALHPLRRQAHAVEKHIV